MQLPVTDCYPDTLWLVVAQLLDASDTEDVEQTFIGIYLTISIQVVGVCQLFLGMVAGTLQNATNIVGRQSRFGLKPECNSTSHDWCRHGGAGIHSPDVCASVNVETFHMIAGRIRIFLIVLTAERRYDVFAWCRHVGFCPSVYRGTY